MGAGVYTSQKFQFVSTRPVRPSVCPSAPSVPSAPPVRPSVASVRPARLVPHTPSKGHQVWKNVKQEKTTKYQEPQKSTKRSHEIIGKTRKGRQEPSSKLEQNIQTHQKNVRIIQKRVGGNVLGWCSRGLGQGQTPPGGNVPYLGGFGTKPVAYGSRKTDHVSEQKNPYILKHIGIYILFLIFLLLIEDQRRVSSAALRYCINFVRGFWGRFDGRFCTDHL